MIGLTALAIIGFWAFVSSNVSAFLTKGIKHNPAKRLTMIALAALIFIAPVADDIAGGFQFRELCNQQAVISVDEEKARNKTVVWIDVPIEEINNLILPIRKHNWSFKDIHTGELLISWNEYHAKGGWLSHLIGFPGGNPPYTFNGHCVPKNSGNKIFKKLNIKVNYN